MRVHSKKHQYLILIVLNVDVGGCNCRKFRDGRKWRCRRRRRQRRQRGGGGFFRPRTWRSRGLRQSRQRRPVRFWRQRTSFHPPASLYSKRTRSAYHLSRKDQEKWVSTELADFALLLRNKFPTLCETYKHNTGFFSIILEPVCTLMFRRIEFLRKYLSFFLRN